MSHANPEDNAAAAWFATKLKLAGYQVFVDLELLGGADFWSEIEACIRDRAAKIVFLTSKFSNRKPGTLKELQLAEVVARALDDTRFVVPLLIDELAHADLNIQLQRLNVLPSRNWASGLKGALDALESAGVPKRPAEPTDVKQLLQGITAGAVFAPDSYLSNWFPIAIPSLYAYRLDPRFSPPAPQIPNVHWTRNGDSVFSFASPDELQAAGIPSGAIRSTELMETQQIGRNHAGTSSERGARARDAAQELVRGAFAQHCATRGFQPYQMSQRNSCFYLPHDFSDKNRVFFDNHDGRRSYRQLVGQNARRNGTRYWHFAVSAHVRFAEPPVLVLSTHAVFSGDGRVAWSDPARQHRARRQLSRSWWNEEWRDRLMAAAYFLSDGGSASLCLSPTSSIRVSPLPVRFDSQVSYEQAVTL
ncbi:MAG: toll/interleukin-1 receptor domain-containing protein [Dehalococcoidia bacterium]|nr:toll/interleukin-1 receptor domain-containing protein [Dehalococcoidia bacterium]